VQVYEQLLNPIATVLQKNMGLLPGGASAEELGWGPEGRKLAPALRGIGVEPPQQSSMLKSSISGSIDDSSRFRRGKSSSSSRGDYSVLPLLQDNAEESLQQGFERRTAAKSDADSSGSSKMRKGSDKSLFSVSLEPGSASPLSRQPLYEDDMSASVNSRSGTTDTAQQHAGESEVEDGISAQTVLKSLKRYWKKPMKPYMPTEESFADYYRHKQELSRNQNNSKNNNDNNSNVSAPTMASSASMPSATALKNSNKLSHKSHTAADIVTDFISSERNDKVKEENRLKHDMMTAKRRERKKDQRRVGVIPWEMLDELDGVRTRFDSEKSYVEFYKKF
jgi:hypothetical protein